MQTFLATAISKNIFMNCAKPTQLNQMGIWVEITRQLR